MMPLGCQVTPGEEEILVFVCLGTYEDGLCWRTVAPVNLFD